MASLGGKCCICGYHRCIRSLAAHHLDPTVKDFNISRAKCIAWEKTVAELRKCVLLCQNCHGEVHEGLATVPDDAQRFDEAFVIKPLPPSVQKPRPTIDSVKHGTCNAYFYHGCRCDACRDKVNSDNRRRYQERKAASKGLL